MPGIPSRLQHAVDAPLVPTSAIGDATADLFGAFRDLVDDIQGLDPRRTAGVVDHPHPEIGRERALDEVEPVKAGEEHPDRDAFRLALGLRGLGTGWRSLK